MRKFFATLLTIMLVFGTVGTAKAATIEELQYFNNQIEGLINAGEMSNNEVYGIYVDMTSVPQGSIASTVYQTNMQLTTLTIANVTPQEIYGTNGARDKLLRFWAYMYNNQSGNLMGGWGSPPNNSITQFVYGPQKIEILNAFVNGIPECLANERIEDVIGSGGGSDSAPSITTTNPSTNPDSWVDAYLSTIFTINSTSITSTSGIEADATEQTTTMDVAPYIKNDRTYVPVAYLAYSLGVPRDGVTWNNETRQVGIAKDDTNITLMIGSPVMLVNQSPVQMDVSPEITNNRTFLPAGWVAEALGADVSWNPETNQVVIKAPIEAPGS